MSRRNREKRAAKQKNRRRASGAEERIRPEPVYDRASLLEHLMAALYDVAMCRCLLVSECEFACSSGSLALR